MNAEVYATHRDGRVLYYPKFDGKPVNVPTAAISIDETGKTFPEGSTWVRGARGWTIEGETPRVEIRRSSRGFPAVSRYSLEYKQAQMLKRA
jgi:hypothetical protein